jgi:arylsulfatase A-like enzyme
LARKRLHFLIVGCSIVLVLALGGPAQASADGRPNIVLIMTDDQGFGDLGVHGNPKIKTPNLDKLAGQSVWLKNFYVSPVCAPTRASLLTGRYSYRTGVVDTYIGRALMYPDEVTIAEVLSGAGYRTGIFGKWHLGDNAPMRPMDQGFQESLVIKGGGIGQSSDPLGGSSYFDPILQRNGAQERYKGYCSDVFAGAAIDFFQAKGERPFFAYLAFNCPHEPLEVDDAELAPYKAMDLALTSFPKLGQRIPPDWAETPDKVARVYAMISNIDKNVGRVLKALEDRKLAENTIVIFLTDNGPAKARFNAGLRGWKGSVFDGGIRVPCYLRWPEHFPAGLAVEKIAAHIDLMPTLLEACGVSPPKDVKLDGKSLLPLLTGKQTAGWPERTLFFQWHRGDTPELGRAFAARSQTYKLVRREPIPGAKPPVLELFDMVHDPLELEDISPRHSDIVSKMYKDYVAWYKDVSATRGYDPSPIDLGGARENPTVLTRQDWRGPLAGVEPNDLGFWQVRVARASKFDVTLRFTPRKFPTVLHLSLNDTHREHALSAGTTAYTFENVPVSAGAGRLEAWVEGNRAKAGVLDVLVRRIGE